MKRLLFIAVTLLSASVWSDTVAITAGSSESSTDLFNGAALSSWENVLSGFTPYDAFGYTDGTIEPGNVIGTDNTTLVIEFNPGLQTINQIVVSLDQDGAASYRSAQQVSFYADIASSWVLVFTANPAFNYFDTYGSAAITVTADLDAAITSDHWRIDVTSYNGNGGSRLLEVDGYNVVPEPASALLLFGGASLIGLIRRFYSL